MSIWETEKEEQEYWVEKGKEFTSSLRYLETLTVKEKDTKGPASL